MVVEDGLEYGLEMSRIWSRIWMLMVESDRYIERMKAYQRYSWAMLGHL